MGGKRVVTLNIESDSIRLLSLKGKKVEKWGSAPLAPGVVREGVVLQPDMLAAVIDALFNQVGLPKTGVLVTLTGMQSIFRILNLPQMKASLLDEAVTRAAGKQIPVPLEELKLVWRSLGQGPAKGQNIFVLGAPKASVDTEVRAFDACGIRPLLMDAKPLALVRAVNKNRVLIINLEPDSFGIILVDDGLPNIVRTIIPRGGEATLEDNTYRLMGEFFRTVEFYNREHLDSNLPEDTPVCLTGSLADNVQVADIIRSQIGYPVESLSLSLKYDEKLSLASYAVNIGLALRAGSIKPAGKKRDRGIRDLRLNILAVRAEPRSVPVGQLLLWLLVLLIAGTLYPSYQGLKSAEDDTDALRAELTAANREFTRAQILVGEKVTIEETLDEADSLERFYESLFAVDLKTWQIFRVIQDALPADMEVTRVALDADEITIDGSCLHPSSVIDYDRSLESKDLFHPVSIVKLTEEDFTISLGRK